MSEAGRIYQSAKASTYKRILAPAGFVKGKRMYVRRACGQIHGIEFQASNWGNKYFVNVGFSYDFLPGIIAMGQEREVEFVNFSQLDFLMSVRLECLMDYPYPDEWGYAKDAPNVRMEMELNARNAIGSVEEVGKRWREPAVFMEALPPKILQADIAEANRRIDVREDLRSTLPPLPVGRILGPDWYIRRDGLAYCLTVIAMRLRQWSLAEAYLAIAQSESDIIGLNRQLKRLRGELRIVK